MSASQDLSKIEEFELDLIECMKQPGRPGLSRRACGLQYRRVQRRYQGVPNDELGMVRRTSVEICWTCPEGRLCSESLQKEWSE